MNTEKIKQYIIKTHKKCRHHTFVIDLCGDLIYDEKFFEIDNYLDAKTYLFRVTSHLGIKKEIQRFVWSLKRFYE